MCVPVTLKHKDVYVINRTVQWFQAILRNRGAVLHLFMTLSGTGETTPRVSVQTYMHQLQDLLFLLIHYLTLNTWFHCARFSPYGMTGLPDSAVCDMQLVTAFRCLCFGPLDQSVQVTSMWGNATITGGLPQGKQPKFLMSSSPQFKMVSRKPTHAQPHIRSFSNSAFKAVLALV